MRRMKHIRMKAPKMPKMGASAPMASKAPMMVAGDTGMTGSGSMPQGMPSDTSSPQGFKHGGHVSMHKAAHGGHKHMSTTTKHGHRPMHRA